jgi:hypothetical protein
MNDDRLRTEPRAECGEYDVPYKLREFFDHDFVPVAGVYIGDDFRKLDRLVFKEVASCLGSRWHIAGIHKIGMFESHYSFVDHDGRYVIVFMKDVRAKASKADWAVNLAVRAATGPNPEDAYGPVYYFSLNDSYWIDFEKLFEDPSQNKGS